MWCDSILTADDNDAESMRRQVHSTTGDSGEEGKARVAEATDRTTRWLDRCRELLSQQVFEFYEFSCMRVYIYAHISL